MIRMRNAVRHIGVVAKTAWKNLVFLAIIGSCVLQMLDASSHPTTTNGGLLLVVNKGEQTLSIVDPAIGRQVAVVPVGGITGHEVAASPDGHMAWVPIYGNSGVGQPGSDGRTISIIDLDRRSKVDEIDLGEPSRPHCAIFGPKDGKLYVTAELTRSIKVIDPAMRKIVDSIPTDAPESHMMAISSDGERAYTANVSAGTVSVVDLHSKKIIVVITVAKEIQRIAISPDDRWVFTADQTKPQIVVIDTQKNIVKQWIALPDLGYGIATTHDGARLFVTHPALNSISVVDLHSMKVTQTIRVPASPQEILVRPDNRVAYVSCDESKQVAVIDLSRGMFQETIQVGSGADGLAWAQR